MFFRNSLGLDAGLTIFPRPPTPLFRSPSSVCRVLFLSSGLLPCFANLAQTLDVACTREPAEAASGADPLALLGGSFRAADGLGIAFSVEERKVTVAGIKPDSYAASNGNLRVGDVVLQIDYKPVATTLAGLKTQALGEPGKPVTLTIQRSGFLGDEQRIIVIKRPGSQGGGSARSSRAFNEGKDGEHGIFESAAYAVGFKVRLGLSEQRF